MLVLLLCKRGTYKFGIRARDRIKIVEIMVDTTTTVVINHEMRENIMRMMWEVIAQELGNKKRHANGDQAVVLHDPNDHLQPW